MDSLHKRYASPFSILDYMIGSGRLVEFVIEMLEQVENDLLWELYLHKVWDGISFQEWKDSLKTEEKEQQGMSEKEIEATIQRANDILSSFSPI